MGDGAPKQKERFSRAGVIAAAAVANYTYTILPDDEHGVDMTVHSDFHTIDFQLKATSSPEYQDDCLVHDLDIRTYNLLRSPERTGYGVLAVIVVGDDTESWHGMSDTETTLTQCAYYLPLFGLSDTPNLATIRLKVPTSNLLTADAMKLLMAQQRARFAS
jgi:hypothetical protein